MGEKLGIIMGDQEACKNHFQNLRRSSRFKEQPHLLTGSVITLSIAKDEAPKFGTVIGIDLGATYSCVSVYKDGHVEIIPNDLGNHMTPSWVAFTDNERLIGEAAENYSFVNPKRTIFDVNRLIGRKFEDEVVQREIQRVPYKIVNKDGMPYIQVTVKDGKTKFFSPQEITSMMINKMKKTAEVFLGKKIKDAVVTVPAYINYVRMRAIKDAETISGLNIARIIKRPDAATIAYFLKSDDRKRHILVFHLGGRTCDVSITRYYNGFSHIYVRDGDTHLGGEDFDERIVEYFIKLIKTKYNKEISKDSVALGRLRRKAEGAKRDLSSQHKVSVEIKSLFDDGTDFSETLTRDQFEELNNDLFRKIIDYVDKVRKQAGLEKSHIDEIILVGGSTSIPKIEQLLKEYFNGKEPKKGISPDEATAYGAALIGGILNGEVKGIDRIKRYTKNSTLGYKKLEEILEARIRVGGYYYTRPTT